MKAITIFTAFFLFSVTAFSDSLQDGQKKLLDQNAAISQPYIFELGGESFVGLPNVFSPKVFFADAAILKAFPFKTMKSFLEIGTGTGYVAVFAAMSGVKKVVATDLNPDAVRNTKINALLHDVSNQVDVRLGNLFEPIRKGEKFDVIYFDLPFNSTERTELSNLERALYDTNSGILEKFLKQGQNYLTKTGFVVFNRSEVLSDMNLFFALAKKYNWKLEIISGPVGDIKITTFRLLRKR